MKKALIIGINKYPKDNRLYGCVNDAIEMNHLLEFNEDETHNFDVKTLIDDEATYSQIKMSIEELYKNNDNLTLLYFSGHGYDNKDDGSIVTVDLKTIMFKDIMQHISLSKSKYNVIILDCCFSGKLGSDARIGDKTVLGDNTVILTACRPTEYAVDDGLTNHGTFTNLLLGALRGGASDILGRITPGSTYSYIDQALGSWEQRPYFKANVSSFVSLRNVCPRILMKDLKFGMSLFNKEDSLYLLDPSYEDTNYRGNREHKAIRPYAKKEHIVRMKILQKMNQNGLVIPVDEQFMYFAAMKTKNIKLTELGRHYWNLCKNGRI
ncbi:MAG: caspase family protein [Candidatus Izemoplasmatales bacterium]|nr:caspase family protein [Candidatus Izemoplasmatales bacterium]